MRPSGDKLGATAESVKFVSCAYSDGEVTGTEGFVAVEQPRAPASSRSGSTTTRRTAERDLRATGGTTAGARRIACRAHRACVQFVELESHVTEIP